MRRGAIVLCGGKSTRMGTAKAMLPFGPELMLQRIVRLLSEFIPVEKIVAVAAKGQILPDLPAGVQLAHDAHADRGPLEGMAAGLKMLSESADAAYVTSCDAPLLVPAFAEQIFELLGSHAIAVPRDGNLCHPLAAVYRVSVLAHISQLLAANRLRPSYLFQDLDTCEIPVDDLREFDPELATLQNLNSPADYQQALQQLNLEQQDVDQQDQEQQCPGQPGLKPTID